MHLVSWDKMTRHKKLGGLGIRIARFQNVAILGKLVWDILNSEDKLWVRMFKDIYLGENLVLNVTSRKGSPTWNSIVKAIELLKDGFQFKLGDGNSSFWYSPWLDKEPLCTHVPYVHYHDMNWSIKDLVDGNDWKLSRLYFILPTNIINKINLAPRFLVHDIPDVWVWTNCTSGIYSVREGYQWLMGAHTSLLGEESWNWIWRLCVPSNIQFFLWQLCHDFVPFRSVLLSRNLISSNICPICNQGGEDMFHALFSCPRAKDVWSFCLHKSVTPPDLDNLRTWMKEFISNIGPIDPIIMWKIWCSRNKCIFEDIKHSVQEIGAQVLSSLHHILKAFAHPTPHSVQ
jgi:hypothetical protein